ncbi:hypothetical protein GCM10010218_01930 [Streptomyces mashuensis]|uniref:Uncharacterized protein n=1 Tax=Streptomyces mashuensis TaxID=33904 RepID=A0A919ASK5_9ACTN|nr:hypothetical protein [Streptomyces mashuensis]GHF24895.1 hypothetical protein GCM10010218_01930 [Streptomyces mashuensis]
MVPAARRTAGTMFAALHGELAAHAWGAPDHEYDAYSLFHQRSLAMGWLDDRSAGGGAEDRMRRAPGLWAMNDADWNDHSIASGADLISWFQVEASAVADDRPLPVRPFLQCAESATAQLGTPRVTAVQLLLPVQGLDAAARPAYAPLPSMLTADWFAGRDPRSRAPVEVNINSGRDPSVPGVAEQLANRLRHLDQPVFAYGSHDLVGEDAVLAPPFDDSFWNGPPLHGMVLRGELTEWSCDAIGWLAEAIADTAASLGIRTPLLVTVTRSHAAD